jgi:hypothetical protein
VLHETSLVEICELLEADRFELVGTTVTFFKVLPRGEGVRWSGELGDQLVHSGQGWRIIGPLGSRHVLDPTGAARPW